MDREEQRSQSSAVMNSRGSFAALVYRSLIHSFLDGVRRGGTYVVLCTCWREKLIIPNSTPEYFELRSLFCTLHRTITNKNRLSMRLVPMGAHPRIHVSVSAQLIHLVTRHHHAWHLTQLVSLSPAPCTEYIRCAL